MKFLGRIFLIICAASAISACTAGEQPPHWWDPSGKYSTLNPSPRLIAPPAKTAAAVQPVVKPVSQPAPQAQEEETFTPVKDAAVEIVDLPAPSVLGD